MVSAVPESINGDLNCKANQKAPYWDDAACIAGEGEAEMRDSRAKVVRAFVCRAGQYMYIYMYGEWIT